MFCRWKLQDLMHTVQKCCFLVHSDALWYSLVYTYGALLVHSCVHSGALMVHLRSGALAVEIFDTQNSVDNVDI